MKKVKIILLVFICGFLPGPLLGATIWSIAGGLWSTTSTTGPDCSCTPGTADDIIVDDAGASITGFGDLTGTIDILNGGTLTINGFTAKSTATVTVRTGGSLNITGDFKPKETSQVIVEAGGTVTVSGRVEVTQDALLVIRGTVTVGGDKMTVTNDASLIIESGGVLNMTDPTSTLDINSVGGTLIVDGTIGTPEEFKLSGGTMGGSGTITHGGTCSGGGTINGLDDTGYCDAGLMNTVPMSSFTSIFYSFADGDWDDNNSWTLTSDGSSGAVGAGIWPGRYDDVIIRNGHTITVDAVDENNFPGITPDGLFRSNVGTFTSSGVDMFFHGGDIIVDAGGILDVNTIRSMYEGYFYVNGTFDAAQDIVNLGNLEVTAAATFNSDDDIVLSGNSFTTFDNTSTGDDDIYMDHTDALLCGTGIVNIGNGGTDPEIQYFNGATDAQICSSLTITCTTNCGAAPFTAPASPGSFSLGYTGPGGVNATDGNSALALWLDANTITQSTGTDLSSWSDLSGYGNDASAPGNDPQYNTNQLNGFPAILFDATNTEYLLINDDASLNPIKISIFTVGNLTATTSSSGAFVSKVDNFVPAQGYVLGRRVNVQQASWRINSAANSSFAGITYGTDAIFTGIYDKVNVELFVNELSGGQDPYGVDITASGRDLLIGAFEDNPAANLFLDGDISEIIILGTNINLSERIIINNYLSSKYNISLSANDVYEMDDPGNGDFDFEVAGIGQASDGTFNKDAQGTGLIRISLPQSMNNNEFMMFGHDGTSIDAINTVDVDGTIIEARFSRVWRVSENDDTGSPVDVGPVRLTFDVSSAPPGIVGSDLRLMITRDDALFADNDVSPQAGSYNIDDQLITFSNVSFEDGDYFTLGTIDNTTSPLPIDLISFTASTKGGLVELEWITASELNNNFFTIERSESTENWEVVTQIEGKGTTEKQNEYTTVDDRPYSGISFYRLKQTDFDGTFTYSKIVSVQLESQNNLKIYPNPSNGSFMIKTGFELDNAEIFIHDLTGRRIQSTITREQYSAEVQLNDSPSGIYILEINDGSRVYKRKVLIDN